MWNDAIWGFHDRAYSLDYTHLNRSLSHKEAYLTFRFGNYLLLDIDREKDPTLKGLNLRDFAKLLFDACPEVYQYENEGTLENQFKYEKKLMIFFYSYQFDNGISPVWFVDVLFFWRCMLTIISRRWREYKVRVPVYGCIILNENDTKAILVKGWKASSGWSFPKGKINKGEKETDCAARYAKLSAVKPLILKALARLWIWCVTIIICFSTTSREVEEEIGLDVSHLIKEEDFIEIVMQEQKTRLYIVSGLPEDTPMLTLTRKEISDIAWVHIHDLPTHKNPDLTLIGSAGKESKFFMVTPFVGELSLIVTKAWMVNGKF